MVKITYRCGNSAEVRGAVVVTAAEVERVRRRTPIHFGSPDLVSRGFRVVARLASGSDALVCLSETRADAIVVTRDSFGALPVGTVRLRLERWVGRQNAGRWVSEPTARVELPRPPRPRRRGQRIEVTG